MRNPNFRTMQRPHPENPPVSIEARAIRNPNAAPANEPYGIERSQVLSQAGFDAALNEISSWPGYAPAPLVRLDGLARALGLREVWYKDERGRFGLKSFKALGGAYAVANVLRKRVMQERGLATVTSRQLVDREFASIVRDATVTCATDGNHGRSVAWGAQLFGCRCVIFVHEHVSQGRRDAIARYGAEVRAVKGNYDEAVRHAAATAAANGWTVVSDTSYPGYREIPLDVMHGYGVMAAEIAQQSTGSEPPTHVFAQAGVGALAAAICAHFWLHWREQRPAFVVVEPTHADCVYQSLAAGHPVLVGGSLETVMAGLACGEVSELAWVILHGGATGAIAVDDAYALEAVRVLANPAAGDTPIVAGETGGTGLAALLAARDYPAIRQTLELDHNARVLLLGSEGDTDPAIYREVVGRTAEEVLA
jgi:diaminopropionate ammonia-lyase